MWSHSLTDQLDVTEGEFWECIEDRKLPVRVQPTSSAPTNALPLSLARQLVNELHLTSEEVEALTLDEAIARMQQHWSQPPTEQMLPRSS